MRAPGPIEKVKARMGYQAATQRPACRNCRYSEQGFRASSDAYPWWCTQGVFGTTAQAVCKEHQPVAKGGVA